jgi:hypothetical protein
LIVVVSKRVGLKVENPALAVRSRVNRSGEGEFGAGGVAARALR